MEITPVPKKNYSTEDIQLLKKHEEIKHLQLVYDKYFKLNGYHNILHILNKHSRPDAILVSGDSETSVIVEHKTRNCSIIKYNSCLLEEQKLNNLVEAGKLFDAPLLYIVSYDDACLIYNFTGKNHYWFDWEILKAPSTEHSNYIVDKKVCMLKYTDANLIISKKDWLPKGKDDLLYYINEKKRRIEELENNNKQMTTV